MKTYPIASIDIEAAKQLQFRVVDAVTRHFDGYEVLNLGDLGVCHEYNKPRTTRQVEKVFADVFDAQDALLVRGAGTGAIRWALIATLRPGDGLLVHMAPIYPTTKTTVETMGLKLITADFNSEEDIRRIAADRRDEIKAALVQHTRQQIEDSYDFVEVVELLKQLFREVPVVTDDNYAALKAPRIGCQAGAEISTFSCFKTLGPEGVGVLLGSREYIERAARLQYSGGSQIQGHEAMEALRGLVYAPVALAIQAEVGEEIVRRLNDGELPEVKTAFLASAQSKVILVEFKEEIAEALLEVMPRCGAAAHPVGSESRYEFSPMIYRVSGTFRQADPSLEKRMIRINPMRSGSDTIIRILRKALKMACS